MGAEGIAQVVGSILQTNVLNAFAIEALGKDRHDRHIDED